MKLFSVFSRGPLKKGGPEATASFASPNIHHCVSPQLEQYQPQVIFQQNDAPPHWGLEVCQFLNETFPDWWIGRDGLIP